MSKRLRRYVQLVTVAGMVALVVIFTAGHGWEPPGRAVSFATLLVTVVLGDLAPSLAPRRSRDGLQRLHRRQPDRHVARRNGDKTAVLVLDVNGFGEVNDSLGRSCGDALLQQIAEQLVQTLRGVDTVARIGADEFAVVLHGVRNRDDVEIVADNLRPWRPTR